MAPTWFTTAQKRDHDLMIGWCARQRGFPFDPKETEFWQEGWHHWPEPLRKPPTLSLQMSQKITRRPI